LHARRVQVGDVSEAEQRGDPRTMPTYDTRALRGVVRNGAAPSGFRKKKRSA
jgi:hypothetical protein